ncbi:MAG: aromatic amino acid transport family protein [bacterium]|nr:aromatic amino acid transport family protein [bacterium]
MSDARKLLVAIATLTSVIIGTGFFTLPYVASQAGIWITSGYFLILGALVLLIHLMFAEVALKTPDFMRLPGFAQFHLGKWGKKMALASMAVGSFGTLLIYLIMGGEFLTNLLQPVFGGNQLFYTLAYYTFVACFIYFGIRPLAKIDFVDLAAFGIALLIIWAGGHQLWRVGNFLTPASFGKFFLPYGPLLFTLWGATMIPEIEEMLGDKKGKLLKKAVWASMIISAIFYFLFMALILGISGKAATPDAFSGLKPFLGQGIAGLGFLLGIITIFTSFAAIGITLEKVFRYDFKIPKNLAFLLVTGVPLVLFSLGMRNFLEIIGLVGGVMMGIEGILILLMYKKVHPKRSWVYPLILIFLGGIIYQIIYFVK